MPMLHRTPARVNPARVNPARRHVLAVIESLAPAPAVHPFVGIARPATSRDRAPSRRGPRRGPPLSRRVLSPRDERDDARPRDESPRLVARVDRRGSLDGR